MHSQSDGIIMDHLQPYQIPALIVAILAVLGVFYKSVRVWSRHEKTIEGHAKMLEKCAEVNNVTVDDCNTAKRDCRIQQTTENERILNAIRDLTIKFEARQESNHAELMKMNKAVGRLEGTFGRLRFDSDGVIS